jgi:hypothetical protein
MIGFSFIMNTKIQKITHFPKVNTRYLKIYGFISINGNGTGCTQFKYFIILKALKC